MERFDPGYVPTSIKSVQRGLEPYIRERREASRVRKVLAAHLSSQVQLNDALISSPLSLVSTTATVDTLPTGVRGIRKEYIKCVQANIKAQREYERVKVQHRSKVKGDKLDDYLPGGGGSLGDSFLSFLEVVEYRRKYEKLRVIQDYMDKLAQKPAAAGTHLDLKSVLKDMQSLPKVPQEVMNASGPRNDSEGADIGSLLERLEKSVLRAQLLLEKEHKLLTKVRAGQAVGDHSPGRPCSRLEALGTARNELINWIEVELASAGENPEDDPNEYDGTRTPNQEGKHYLESQLALVQRQYAQYIKARQSLIIKATSKPGPPHLTANDNGTEQTTEREEPTRANALSHIVYPYLEELAAVSNEQKSIIQQKSHLTIGLAKQLKEAGQGLDRLAEESHLLPAHPLPSGGLSRRSQASFADEISNSEKPNSSRRAQAWVFASDESSLATRDAILLGLEEGEKSTSDAQRLLMDLYELFGEEIKVGAQEVSEEDVTKSGTKDIWGQLDGQLGSIQNDDMS